jgi:hypothetical protein
MSVLLQMPTNILWITFMRWRQATIKALPTPHHPPSPLQEGEGKFPWKDGESILLIR